MNVLKLRYLMCSLLFFSLTFSFYKCKTHPSPEKKVSKIIATGDSSLVKSKYGSEGIIFSPIHQDKHWRYNAYARWHPTKKEALTADSVLVEYILQSPEATTFTKENINKYVRQYFGLITPDGIKVMWINCFKYSNIYNDRAYWYSEIVDVDDGRDRFFNVTIDVVKNKCVLMRSKPH